jgi:hypothetical protein
VSWSAYFKRKRGVLLLGCVAGVLGGLRHSPTKTLPELAAALGHASSTHVAVTDVQWEAAGSAWADMVFGRYVTFLGAQTEGGPRDVYRARVLVSYEGTPFHVGAIYNLTQTALGDDHNLIVRGHYAAYATYAFGQEQSATLLDLRGEGARNTTVLWSDRLMGQLTNLQLTGTINGVGRSDVTFDEPIDKLWLQFAGASTEPVRVDMTVSRGAQVSAYSVDPESCAVTGEGVHAEPQRHLPKRPIFWLVDTVRAVPWIGPAPIAWLEQQVFATKDTLKKLAFNLRGTKDEVAIVAEVAAPTLDTSQASLDSGHWPPPPIKSIWKNPEVGEGEWVLPEPAWLKRLPTVLGETPPAPFVRTFVRTDEARQYSRVLLVAMDTRQLDLDMEAGVEDPKPLTGPPGAGRVPRDPSIYTRIAATFNGGFKTEHGNYGMMLKRRVLLPPVAGAATVIALKDGTVGLGSWGNTSKVSGIKGISDTSILSLRQNLEALVDEGVVNPGGRSLWGFTLPDSGMQTERSGLCVTEAGHLIYAWGDDVSAITLGKGMQMAGCKYGIHLDMNPHHTGLAFTNIVEIKGKNYKAQLLTKQMEIAPDRYIEYAPKDFFYMLMRTPEPPPAAGIAWSPDEGTQPAPRWLPALWRARAGETTRVRAQRRATPPARGHRGTDGSSVGVKRTFRNGTVARARRNHVWHRAGAAPAWVGYWRYFDIPSARRCAKRCTVAGLGYRRRRYHLHPASGDDGPSSRTRRRRRGSRSARRRRNRA